MKTKFLSILLAAILLLSLAGCSNGQTPAGNEVELKTVKLGFPGTANFIEGVAGIAQENKFIDEELEKIGYKVEYVPFAAAGPAVNEALAGKKIDLAIYADFPGLVLKSRGIDISLLAITDNYFNATLIVKNDSPIQTVKDLKGKKIALTKGTYLQKYFLELLELNGLTEKDVEIINVVTTDAVSALLNGNVDALIYVDSFVVPLLVNNTAKEIDSTRLHPQLRAQGVFVGVDSFIDENPDVPTAIIKALVRAKDFVKNNPEESLAIWTKTGLDLDGLNILYGTDTTQYNTYFPLEINQEAIDKLTSTKVFLFEQGLITDDFDIEAFANRTFYEEAL